MDIFRKKDGVAAIGHGQHLHIHEELREMDWEIFKELCKGIPQEQVELFLALSEKMLSNIESL